MAPATPRLHLRILGEPSVEGPEGKVTLASRKGRALLWYLGAHPHRAFPRAHLASLLWEDKSEALGRNSLTTLLNLLRRTLPSWPLRVTRDSIGWDLTRGSVDADLFIRQVAAGRAQVEISGGVPQPLVQAAALWRGPFLDGFNLPGSEAYEDWLHDQRMLWEHRLLETLSTLAQAEEAAGAWSDLAAHARRALEVDPYQERFYRWLMLACYQTGDRGAALAAYRSCRSLLEEHLGAEPSPETDALHAAIVKGALPRRPARGAGPPRRDNPVHPPPDPSASEHAPAWVPASPWPLVGRQRELGIVRQVLRRHGRSSGAPGVLLFGEAGIGKTRLVEEALRDAGSGSEASPEAGWTLTGRCYEESRDLAFAPFVEALGRLLPGIDPARLELPDHWLSEASRLLPDLAFLKPGLPPPPTLDPARERQRMFEGVARLLAALPTAALIMEDLHWADEGSLSLLAYLGRHPALSQTGLILTARAGDLPEAARHTLRRLEREGTLIRIRLTPLSPDDVAALVEAAAGRRDDALAERLHARTGGNPLFTVEFLRSLAEGGRLEAGRPVAVDDLPVPESLQGAIEERLSRLSPPARRLAAAASVFARPVRLDVLCSVADLSWEAGAPILDALVSAGVLVEHREGAEAAVSFGHELIRQAIRDHTSGPRRRTLHRRAFACLAEAAGADPAAAGLTHAEQIAYHATHAGLWEEGLHWSLLAAEAAEAVHAYAGAARLLEQALVNLERLPLTSERRRQRVDIRLRAAELNLRHDPTRSEDLLASADSEAAAAGDRERQNRASLVRAMSFIIQGRLDLAAPLLERLLPVARLSGNRHILAYCLMHLGQLLATRGELRRAIPLLEEARALHAGLGHTLQEAETGGTLASVYAGLGEFDRAAALATEYAERGRRRGDHATTALLLGHLASVAHFRGSWQEALSAGRAGMAAARAGEHRLHEYVACVFTGLPLARTGDLEGGIAAQEESIALASAAGTRVLVDRAYAWLGEMRLDAGDLDGAARSASTGLRIAEEDGYLYGIALNARVLGQIAAAEGRHGEAERRLHEALERFAAMGARPEVARCHLHLARTAATEAERRRHAGRAEELCLEMGMAWHLERLRAL